LERRDQGKYQALLEQLRQRQEQASPQYQIALERLKEMRDKASKAMEVVKGREAANALAGMWAGFGEMVEPVEWKGFTQSEAWQKAPAEVKTEYTNTYRGYPYVGKGISIPEYTTGQRKKLTEGGGRGPTPPGELKVASEAEKFFYGEKPKVTWNRDTGQWEAIPESGKKGFIEQVRDRVASFVESKTQSLAGMPQVRERVRGQTEKGMINSFAWQAWDKKKPTLPSSVAKHGERLMEYHFGPRPMTQGSLKEKWMGLLGADYKQVKDAYGKNGFTEQEMLGDLEERQGRGEF